MAKKKIIEISNNFPDKVITRKQFWENFRKSEDDTVYESLLEMEKIIKKYMPEGSKGFTGGYLQRLSSDNSIVLFYGNDKNNNRITKNLKIPDDKFEYISDIFFIYMHFFQIVNKPKRDILEI